MIKEAVIKGSDENDAGKFDPNQRAKYMNASEAMSCIRKQWYLKFQEEDGEEQDWGYAKRGTHGEKYLVDSINGRKTGMSVYHAGNTQLSLQDEERRISVTPDGVLCKFDDVTGDQYFGVEFKTIDPRTNIRYLPKENHIVQLQIAMELIVQYEDYKIEDGYLVYMDASNFNKIYEFKVERDPNILKKVGKRSKRLFRAKSADTLDREGRRNGGKECNTMCSFKKVCGVASTEPTSSNSEDFELLVSTYMRAKEQEDVAKAQKTTVGESIKQIMQEKELQDTTVDDIEVKYVVTKGRESLDKKALAKKIDLTPFIKVGSPSERLTITRT
jgi:hypothetical protein